VSKMKFVGQGNPNRSHRHTEDICDRTHYHAAFTGSKLLLLLTLSVLHFSDCIAK